MRSISRPRSARDPHEITRDRISPRRCTLLTSLRSKRGFDEREELLLYDVDEEEEIAELMRQQRANDWTHPKHAATCAVPHHPSLITID